MSVSGPDPREGISPPGQALPRVDPWQWREHLRREIRLPREVERIPPHDAVGRELAEDLRSPEDLPALSIAAMDGFAVRRADLVPGSLELPVSADIAARPGAVSALVPGTAARIMTGAPVPEGADVVIEVEATGAAPFGPCPSTVVLGLGDVPPPWRHIRRPGEEVQQGSALAQRGDRVGAGLLGISQALGLEELPVLRPFRVAVVVTGDELSGAARNGDGGTRAAPVAGRTLAAGAVRESNGAMLGAALREDGAEETILHSGDSHRRLRRVLEQAAEGHDLVVTTGGIGQGAHDVVRTLLGELGARTSRFEHIALRPGAPQGAGRLPGGTPVIHLPGTPVGALVGYHLFVRPLLAGDCAEPRRILLGEDGRNAGAGRAAAATGHGALTGEEALVRALPARLRRDELGREIADLLPGRRLLPYARADAIVLHGGRRRPTADDTDRGVEDDAGGAVTALVVQL